MTGKIIGIVGAYRKGGTTDQLVSRVLDAASAQGASTRKVFLTDLNFGFCTNCRECGQTPGAERGRCVLDDELDAFLDQVDDADALVVGSPVNYGDVTAVTRQFLERCSGYLYYPLGAKRGPVARNESSEKPIALVVSSAAPSIIARVFFHTVGTLKQLAKMFGGRVIGVLSVGMAVGNKDTIDQKHAQRAKEIGSALAAAIK